MSANTYMYRLRIFSKKGPVQVDFRDPHNVEGGNPGGKFRYKKYGKTIEPLAARASAAGKNTRALSKDEIRQLGEALFKTLFDKELRTHFLERYHKVVHGSKGNLLRLELEFNEANAPELVALPWEFMRAPSNNQITGALWLATAPRLILARTRGLWLPADNLALAPDETLKIGVAVADPEGLGKVKYKKLWAELQNLAGEHDRIELLPLAHPATRDSIDELLGHKPHIFHFIGHGRLEKSNGREFGEIAIVREPHLPRWIDAEQFSTFLNRHRPKIVVLQACKGAAGASGEAFVSVASQIVRQNIPAVIAMQYEVSNATARRFARRFYRRLAEGKPVDEAVQEGRNTISDFHESLDFSIPVLYMRSRHGQVFSQPVQTLHEVNEV
ncbi:MAG TPA: CHAT domain-containing protein [Candidatus Sulfomarinibacteraceae bacterium]|nr:CHAT domain-containing protein [Candidatus Sulfomarinibacteraceae bacterium]